MTIKCRLCGRQGHEAGLLTRVNELGVEGIWECRPSCTGQLPWADAVVAAIEGTYDPVRLTSQKHPKAWAAADAIDALLSRRLTPSAYLEQAPSIQELTAIIVEKMGD